jgi:hypothetical protein
VQVIITIMVRMMTCKGTEGIILENGMKVLTPPQAEERHVKGRQVVWDN